MASRRDLRRSRLKKNSGSVKSNILVAPTRWFTTIGAAPELTPESMDNNVATTVAMGAISTPSDGDTCYVQSNESYYIYVAATTSWEPLYKSVISAAHVFEDGKGFITIEATKNKKGLVFNGPEEFDVTGLDGQLTVSVPGMDPQLSDFISESPLESYICLIPLTDGRYVQIGTESNPATLKLNNAQTGTEILNYKGAELMISSEQDAIYFYSGGTPALMGE